MEIIFSIIVAGIIFYAYVYINKNYNLPSSNQTRFGKFGLPYKKKQYFFYPSEKDFYITLNQLLQSKYKDKYVVFCKTRVIDLLYVAMKNKFYKKRHENKIKPRHVDYVICDAIHFSPILAIELNGSSHNESDVAERDQIKQAIFSAANLPLVLFSSETLNQLEIDEIISKYLMY